MPAPAPGSRFVRRAVSTPSHRTVFASSAIRIMCFMAIDQVSGSLVNATQAASNTRKYYGRLDVEHGLLTGICLANTASGLMTYYVLVFMRIAPRKICIAGSTLSPDSDWMKQMARNLTMAGEGMLHGCRYLLHDRDAKFCAAFGDILRSAGIEPLVLPPRSPNLNAHLERWNRSVKEECLSKMILFGETSYGQKTHLA